MTAIREASMATCIVRRGRNSPEQIRFHERLAQDNTLTEECKKHHKEKARKAREGVVGTGTGMKMIRHRWYDKYSQFSQGLHRVVTNNHVIMNKEEAKYATVTFDYHSDDNGVTGCGTRTFTVCDLVEPLCCTTDSGYKTNLDYSILVLRAENDDDHQFLKARGLFKEFHEPPHEFPEFSNTWVHPALMFSHPRGLAMRVSVGKYPDVTVGEHVSHVKHSLPSCMGSSGANILISGETKFREWDALFLHYRHGWAVSHRAIYLKQVELYNKKRGYEAMKAMKTFD